MIQMTKPSYVSVGLPNSATQLGAWTRYEINENTGQQYTTQGGVMKTNETSTSVVGTTNTTYSNNRIIITIFVRTGTESKRYLITLVKGTN